MKLKDGKASGPDGIPAELYKCGIDEILPVLSDMIRKAWAGGRTPKKWQQSLLVPVHKKGDVKNCSNYRGISLTPLIGKIYSLLVLDRIGKLLDEKVSESQSGFRGGRGTTDNIFVLRQLLQRRHEFQKDTMIAYLDFSAAFDSVDRKSLWMVLTACGIPPFFVNMIKRMYEDSLCIVRAYGEKGQPFGVSTGVRQGDVMSPLLFIHAVDWIITHAGTDSDGVVMGEDFVVKSTEYADDVALIAETAGKLQHHIDRFDTRGKMLGLVLNANKCKYTSTFDPGIQIAVNGAPIERVQKFNYLGSFIEESGNPTAEVKSRIGKASAVFKSLRKCLWSRRQISLVVKRRLFDSLVMPVLLYGLELLSLNVAATSQIASFEMHCLRAILGVGWQQHITNEEVLQRFDRREHLPVRLLRLRMRWLGHLTRMKPERFARRAFFSKIPSGWRRRPGGQRLTWDRCVRADTGAEARVYLRLHGLPWEETIISLTQDRLEWGNFVTMCAKRRSAA